MSNPTVTTDLLLNSSEVKTGLRGFSSFFKRWAQGLKSSFSSVFRGIGGVLRKSLIAATAGLAAGGVFGLIATNAKSAADEIESKFRTVFRNLEEEADLYARTLADATGGSLTEMRKGMSEIGDILKPLGASTEAAMDLSAAMVQLGSDLASFNNQDPSENIERLKGIMTGSHEMAKVWGVSINDATLKLELMEMGLAKSVQTATEYQKALARMSLLLKGTTDAQGDLERTQDSYANTLRRMKSGWTEFLETAGEFTMPIFRGIIRVLDQTIDKMKELMETDAAGGVLSMVETIGDWLGYISDLVSSISFDNFRESLGNAGKEFWDVMMLGIDSFYTVFQSVVERLAEQLAIQLNDAIAKTGFGAFFAIDEGDVQPLVRAPLAKEIEVAMSQFQEGIAAATSRLQNEVAAQVSPDIRTPEERAAARAISGEGATETIQDLAQQERMTGFLGAMFTSAMALWQNRNMRLFDTGETRRREIRPMIEDVQSTYNRLLGGFLGDDTAADRTAKNTEDTVKTLQEAEKQRREDNAKTLTVLGTIANNLPYGLQ